MKDEGLKGLVDVSGKAETERTARASAFVSMSEETLEAVRQGRLPKGDALEAARIAALQAAKETFRLLPHCHPIRLTHVAVRVEPADGGVAIQAEARAIDRTGVEMEALTAASVAALTIYDMCKSLERGMVIERIQLEEKAGGRSGHWRRDGNRERPDR